MRKLVGLPLIDIRRIGDCSRSVRHHLNSQVHLEPGEPHNFFALLQSLRIDFGIFGLCRVGINTDFVAKLAASNEGVHGRVVNLSSDIPKSHLDGADATALAGVSAELLDLAKKLVEV